MQRTNDHPVERQSSRPLVMLAAALALVALATLALGRFDQDADASSADQLLAPPVDGGVWIVGNSIFKTGVEPSVLEERLGGPNVDFEYHGGHYTSLWYLITANALPDIGEKPGLVIWGFRPEYAAQPAFRQNKVNDTELFLVDGDPTYTALAERIDAPSDNPIGSLAEDLHDRVSRLGIWRSRDEASAAISELGTRIGVRLAETAGTDGGTAVRQEVLDGDGSLLDLLNRVTTGGDVELAEERVIDGVGDFITGEIAAYEDSFVPIIAQQITDLGIDQLVIIWPPRVKAEGNPRPQDDVFAAEAVSHLTSAGVQVLNLYDDPLFDDLEFYAEGDHFNSEGRDVVTELLARTLIDRNLVPG